MSGLAMSATPSQQAPSATVTLKLADAVKQAQDSFAKGDLGGTEKIATAILAKQPQHIVATQLLAGVAEKRGQGERAIEILQRSLTGGPGDALSLMNLCRIFRLRGQLEDSRQMGERAVAIGTVADAFVDLADTYTALNERARAFELYERAVAKQPEMARAHMGLAQALLFKGDFRAGWAEYEWRYKMQNTQNLLPKFKQATWNGMALADSRLLVVCEQGYGDCFQFVRYLPLISERVKGVFVGTGPEIKSLMERVDGNHVCYDRWEQIPPFEFQITMSSLPLVFGTTLETIPAKVPYLSADPAKVNAWRARLTERAQGRKTVGFVWQGRPTHPNDRQRSIGLGHLTRLMELDDFLPVSLQIGAGSEQLAQHPAHVRVLDAAEELKDFGDTAALISALDCVVTIDSAIAHLTGGLGKRGYVMLPYAGEWRWLDGRPDSPWYPTLELVRQDATGSWDGVVTRVLERLRTLS
jgi:Tfp pilus assembly protein PilF